MTDFQVGDRVSVEGVVTYINGAYAEVEGVSGGRSDVVMADLTLIERPRRKLRVGSVWQRDSSARPVQRFAWTGGDFVGCPGAFVVGRGDFDSHPERWHEVPVEELEREAQSPDTCQHCTCTYGAECCYCEDGQVHK